MVTFCGVFACGKRGSHLSFFRLPKIRLTEGEQTRQLSEERQLAWLSNIVGLTSESLTQSCQVELVGFLESFPWSPEADAIQWGGGSSIIFP